MMRWFQLALMCLGLSAHAAHAQEDPDTDEADKPVVVIPGEIRMALHPIADGIIREGQWATLRVTLANGADSTTASVTIDEREDVESGSQSYRREVALPQGSKKDIQLLWRAGSSSRDRLVRISVGPESVERIFPVRALSDDDVGIGVIGEDSLGTVILQSAWTGPVPGLEPRVLADSERTVRSGLIPTADIPDSSAGLMALDWIVWPQADPSALTPGQLDALLGWTANGGNLLITVTDSWSAVASSALSDALPVDFIGEADGSVGTWLSRMSKSGLQSSELIPIATVLPSLDPERSANVLALADDGRPVWTAGVYGLGSVHVVAVDLSVGPLVSDIRREPLWRHLLWLPPTGATASWYTFGSADMTSWYAYAGAPRYADDQDADALMTGGTRLAIAMGLVCPTERCPAVARLNATQTAQNGGYTYGYGTTLDDRAAFSQRMRELLADIPGVAPLPLPWLAAFAIVYLMLIGPVDYIVLRVIGRQPWTWVTFPLMVAVFSAIALIGTSVVKGSQAIVTRYEIVDVLPGADQWRGHTWLGVFSTKKTDLTLTSGFDNAVVRPVGDGGFVQDASTRSDEGSGYYAWRAQTWSLAYVQSEWTAPNLGRVVVEVRDATTLVVRNELGVDLAQSELRARGRYLVLDGLSDGEEAVISVPSATLEGLARHIASDGRDVPGNEVGGRQAYGLFATYPQTFGGSMALESPVGFIGQSAVAYEPLVLTGLTPVERPVTVFRSPVSLSPVRAEAP